MALEAVSLADQRLLAFWAVSLLAFERVATRFFCMGPNSLKGQKAKRLRGQKAKRPKG